MQQITLGNSDIRVSRLVYGCMRIVGDNSAEDREKGKQAIRTAIAHGYTQFDHADIYGGGECESLFAEVLAEDSTLRDKLILINKAGIRREGQPFIDAPTRYDFSGDYIIHSVESSLQRLGTDYLDVFLLHQPDYLFNADEVAATFETLKKSGKVKHFGVSNFSPTQFNLLQSRCDMPLIINQVEINIHNIERFSDGTLDMCQQHKITPQAWCPIGGVVYPAWGNTFSAEDEQRIKVELQLQSEKYGVEDWVVALAWLLIHPANICPIVGSTTPERIIAAKAALSLSYTREDWYRLLEARNGVHVP